VSSSYQRDDSVPLVNTGGHAAVGYPPLRVERSSIGFGDQGSSPVVPTPLAFECYSSGTESDSVFSAVQRFVDPQSRDPTLCQITDTAAPPIRRQSTSSIDSLVGNVQCTGTQQFPGPTTYQVSQIRPTEVRPATGEERAHGYPAESHVGYAQVSAPPQEFCSHPPSVHAGYARQVVQAQYVREPVTGIPANGARIPNPVECYMDPVVNRVPQRPEYGYTHVVQQQQSTRNMMKRSNHAGVNTTHHRLGINEPPTFVADRLPERQIPTPRNSPRDDGAHPLTMENPGTDSREVGEGRRPENVTHGEQGNNHSHDVTSRSRSAKRTKTNTGKSGSGHRTRTKGRHDSSPDSSSSSSRSRSRSGGRQRNNEAVGNGPEKKPTERPDKSSWDGKNGKSQDGAGDGHGPPEKSVKKEPARDPSPNEDDQTQPATQAVDEASLKKPSGYINARLQAYDGTDCFETWLARFECVADYMEWTERDKLFHLKFNLTGNAGHILWNMGNKTTVEAAIRLLRNRFGTAGQSEWYRAELHARHRKPGEDLQHLYQEIARLILLAYPDRSDDVTDLVARDAFLDDLDDETLRVRIMDREPPNLDAALKHAIKLESYTGGCKTAEPNRSNVNRPPRPKEHFSRVVTEQDHYLLSTPSSGTQPVGISEDSLVRCFEKGLQSYLDKNPQQNQLMKGPGRKPDDRDAGRPRGGGRKYMNTSSTPSYGDQGTAAGNHGDKSASGRPVPYQGRFQGQSRGNKSASFRPPTNQGWKDGGDNTSPRSGNGNQPPQPPNEPRVQVIDDNTRKKTTYLMVYWKGKQYNALLDSGCEVSVVGRRLLPKNIELSPPETDLFAANRTKIPLLGRMRMDFTVAGKPYTAKLAVTSQVDELILGIDWLQETAAMWDFRAGKIYLGGRWIWLQQKVTEDRVRRVYAPSPLRFRRYPRPTSQ